MILAGCTTTSRGERRLNLSPLFFYSEDPGTDRSRFEILGPLFSRERAGSTFLYTFAPSFIILMQATPSKRNFSIPSASTKPAPATPASILFPSAPIEMKPCLKEPPVGKSFPFYGGRTSQGERYGGVFPLLRHL